MSDIHTLGPWLRRFLSEHIVTERNLARNTQQSYRDPTLEIAFTGVRNLVSGSEYADMRWSGVEMTSGAFDAGSDGDSIAGRFYGPTHAEVGGVFERNDILGAFGASRQ